MRTMFVFVFVWNFITFVLMGWDKQRAKKKKGRVSEKTLIVSGFLLGGVGIGTGMLCFQHKTRKWKFRLLVPAGILVNFVVLWLIIRLMNIF